MLAVVPPDSAANCAAAPASRSAASSSKLPNVRSASRNMRAWTPQPTKPTRESGRLARYLVATPAAAPVRSAVSKVASMIASGNALRGSLSTYVPITVGKPKR
jgi:hypothetical protein